MPQQYISKIILNGVVQMDVTQDTVAANNLLQGETATGADGAPVTGAYVPASSNDLFVTISYNDVTEQWEPDYSHAEISAAYAAGKDIYAAILDEGYNLVTGYWDSMMGRYIYAVAQDASTSRFMRYAYSTGDVVTLLSDDYMYYTGNADATAADVRSGKVFYNANGQETGSATARTSSDLTASGATVTAPAGFYASAATKSVASGTEGTPTASKGAVSNHSVSVTPSVTNTTGYITGGAKTGTAVTVSASELVSGSETKTANGTYNVTNLASLVVAVPIVTYYTGSSAPSSSLGQNGDIYLQT